ncbi:hypothetical protein OC846_005745 [Tilletia horrida]|uniref:Uncharacterized protein n=1 Tax=Tilletia horrida TaxID=155126 RepID=A0AAN6GL68_9BASI|nr:hypothetical protein OC845_006217 [Tilletia horrida]KAK0545263.1 hypothetical protein OC846_005745 [Tilletia horrida]KAK0561241.1 hypothetical protein OC861_005920 [Tilletia horrida]
MSSRWGNSARHAVGVVQNQARPRLPIHRKSRGLVKGLASLVSERMGFLGTIGVLPLEQIQHNGATPAERAQNIGRLNLSPEVEQAQSQTEEFMYEWCMADKDKSSGVDFLLRNLNKGHDYLAKVLVDWDPADKGKPASEYIQSYDAVKTLIRNFPGFKGFLSAATVKKENLLTKSTCDLASFMLSERGQAILKEETEQVLTNGKPLDGYHGVMTGCDIVEYRDHVVKVGKDGKVTQRVVPTTTKTHILSGSVAFIMQAKPGDKDLCACFQGHGEAFVNGIDRLNDKLARPFFGITAQKFGKLVEHQQKGGTWDNFEEMLMREHPDIASTAWAADVVSSARLGAEPVRLVLQRLENMSKEHKLQGLGFTDSVMKVASDLFERMANGKAQLNLTPDLRLSPTEPGETASPVMEAGHKLPTLYDAETREPLSFEDGLYSTPARTSNTVSVDLRKENPALFDKINAEVIRQTDLAITPQAKQDLVQSIKKEMDDAVKKEGIEAFAPDGDVNQLTVDLVYDAAMDRGVHAAAYDRLQDLTDGIVAEVQDSVDGFSKAPGLENAAIDLVAPLTERAVLAPAVGTHGSYFSAGIRTAAATMISTSLKERKIQPIDVIAQRQSYDDAQKALDDALSGHSPDSAEVQERREELAREQKRLEAAEEHDKLLNDPDALDKYEKDENSAITGEDEPEPGPEPEPDHLDAHPELLKVKTTQRRLRALYRRVRHRPAHHFEATLLHPTLARHTAALAH